MSWFKKSDKSRRNHRGNRKRILRPEVLQKREMMAGDFVDFYVRDITSELVITGTNDADHVEVFVDDKGTPDKEDDSVKYRSTLEDGREIISGINMFHPNGTQRIRSLRFEGYDGDDYFKNNTDMPVTAEGGDGNDQLVGGTVHDRLFGGRGNDSLWGGHGNDILDGGGDHDRIWGGWGVDDIDGGSGNDELRGEFGSDTIEGGSGNDEMYGGWGNDTMNGGSGNDTMYGSYNNDIMDGESGNDKMYGGSGNDLMLGGSGNDNVNGGNGHDSLMGESGDDLMQGNRGDDFMYGGSGKDTMYGNFGNDLMVGGDGRDFLSGLEGDDRLYGGDMQGLNLNSSTYGNPTLHNKRDAQDWDRDILAGGEGNDLFGIANNSIFSRDKVMDHEDGETILDLDPRWTTAGTGRVNFAGDYGHKRDD
ncbi:MAG: calcium-binding protein [Planctomycetota bacterium]